MPRRVAVAFIAVASVLTAACGGGSSGGGVTVAFVGNSTCPTSGASPYSPSPPDTNQAPVGQPIAEMPHTHVSPPT